MSTVTTKTLTIRCPHCGRQNRVAAAAEGFPRCGNCHQPLPWIVDAGDDDFAAIAEQATIFVLVDMWAAWCAPCRMVSPALEQVARDMAGQLKLVKVDVDSATGVARRFQVMSVPTLLMLYRGRTVARQSGALPVNALRRWVERAMAEASRDTSQDAAPDAPGTAG